MSETPLCPECGCELPAGTLSGHCPQCLLKAGLEPPSQFQTEGVPHSTGSGFVPPTPEELKNVIPQIEILELVAKGGMGAVYKGRQKSLDRLVAVKILPPDIGHDGAFAERFTREAHALGRLNHPNIVAVHDSGQADGLYYFVMEYVDGANLRQLLKEKMFSPKDALAIVPQLCDALQFAHDEGIMHRDIKPENILIDKKGRVKIADFGLAKLLGHDHPVDNLTGTHQVMGTIRYMAPEQMEGAKDIDHRADIYSLGVVFYELLTGELPLGRFAPPSKMVHIDVRLDEIVLRALEREPKHRYQHAGDVKTEVESVVRTPHESARKPNAAANPPGGVAAGEIRFFQWIRELATDLDAIEGSYGRWVSFPLLGFAGFCLFAAVTTFLTGRNPRAGEMLLFGVLWVCLAFLTFNVVWLLRRVIQGVDALPAARWTPEQTADELRKAARLLYITAILTFIGWLVLMPFFDWMGIAVMWAGAAGMFMFFGARRLAKHRDPGTLTLLLAMVPLSPAVALGLPVALRILKMLARPEVKACFEAKSREQVAAKSMV